MKLSTVFVIKEEAACPKLSDKQSREVDTDLSTDRSRICKKWGCKLNFEVKRGGHSVFANPCISVKCQFI